MKPKRNAFAALGWVVWKVGATVGVPYAKKKVRESGNKRDVTIEVKRRGSKA